MQSGPVKAPPATRYAEPVPSKDRKAKKSSRARSDSDKQEEAEEDDEELSEIEDDDDDEDGGEVEEDDAASQEAESEVEVAEKKKDRKRKRKDDFDDLEGKYFSKLVEDDDDDDPSVPSEKKQKGEDDEATLNDAEESDDDGEDTPIVHESLLQKSEEHVDVEVDKANRTLFLGNVSSEAISSSKAKKKLMAHLAGPLSDLDADSGPHKVESIRFRSVAVAGGGMPKRAAFITKTLMAETTKSTNAYAVYSTPLAARTAMKALNGTIVLDRHLRADSVAHPTPVAHRRCIFVGNLGFVDDETVIQTGADGVNKAKKRLKVPADIEEGLWRTFGQHAGKVESVRVPRDPATRVGKGFAYVQFYDGNDVEGALLLDGKKYPPMLPRALRVSRAKDPRKTTLAMERTVKGKPGVASAAGKPKSTKYKHKATSEQQSSAGRASKLFGRSGAAREAQRLKGGDKKPKHTESKPRGPDLTGLKTPEQIVFEGRRASSKDGKPKDLKLGKVRGKKRPPRQAAGRGARRAAEWRKKGDN